MPKTLRRLWWCLRAAWHYQTLAGVEFAHGYAMAESLYTNEDDPELRGTPRDAVLEDLSCWSD